MNQNLLYLHGFLSGPSSEKAQQTVKYFNDYHPNITIHCPQLPFDFDQLPAFIQSLVDQYQGKTLGIVGSSLGGFLATYLANELGAPAVVINPAVKPDELLLDYLGEHQCYYSDTRVTVSISHLPLLQTMRVQQPPSNIKVLLQTNDETLDYKQAEIYYQHCELHIEQGGDHSFQGYSDHLPAIHNYLFN